MIVSVPPATLRRLRSDAADSLAGGVVRTHRLTGGNRWRFGRLNGTAIELDRLEVSLSPGRVAVAVGDEGDLLAVRTRGSLACSVVPHDGGAEEPLGIDLAAWLAESERVDAAAVEAGAVELPAWLLGRWVPVRVLGGGARGLLKLQPNVEYLAKGVCRNTHRRGRGSVSDRTILACDPVGGGVRLTYEQDGELRQYLAVPVGESEVRFDHEALSVIYGRPPESDDS